MRNNNEKKMNKSEKNKVIVIAIMMIFMMLGYFFAEPVFTKGAMEEEFKKITKKTPTEIEFVGETKTNGLITLQETKDGSIYRITYDRWNLGDNLKSNPEPLIDSIEEKKDKKFEIIYTKK